MSQWSLIYEDFDPAQEKRREALCTLGNGYFASPQQVANHHDIWRRAHSRGSRCRASGHQNRLQERYP